VVAEANHVQSERAITLIFSGLLPLPGGRFTSPARFGVETQLRAGLGGLAGHGLHTRQFSPRLYSCNHRYLGPCRHCLDRDKLGGADRWRVGFRVFGGVLFSRRPIQPAQISE
jgi:hypothetical protein